MEEKTNVMRALDKKKLPYRFHSYTNTDAVGGMDVVAALKENPDKVFKTLVTVGKTGNHYVFMLPVNKELDLKKAAKCISEKKIEMIKSKELLPLTGYIHGGCSPIGMKKQFKTVAHKTAESFDTIMFSGGKIGYQVEMNPKDLAKIIPIEFADIATE